MLSSTASRNTPVEHRQVHVSTIPVAATSVQLNAPVRASAVALQVNIVFALLAGFGCVDMPTAPFRLRPLAPSRSMSVAGPLGTFTIPMGPDTPANNLALPTTPTGIFLPDNSTVLITVSGTVQLSRKPGYGGYPMSVSVPLDGKSISAWGANEPAPYRELYVSTSINGPIVPGSDTASRVMLVRLDAGAWLSVARNGVIGSLSCQSVPEIPPAPTCLVNGSPVDTYSLQATPRRAVRPLQLSGWMTT